jgi:phosphoenolpyruvate carboxykinase (ATP)
VPDGCSGVPAHIMDPRQTWEDPEAYDRQAAALVQKFKDNFAQYTGMVSPEVAAAGPT